MDTPIAARLNDLAKRCARSGKTCFSRFLDPPEFDLARHAANTEGVNVSFFGGFEEAERSCAAFWMDDAPEDWENPIVALKLDWNDKYGTPAHRDLLGAVMGLGLERAVTGDIAFAKDGGAVLFALEEVADYLCANLESAGRVTLKVKRAETPVELAPLEGETLRVTVQQARLDAVLAAGYKLSRSEAQKLIAQGLVKLDHAVCLKADAKPECGSVISAKGFGRLRIETFEGETKKGRLAVKLFRYGKVKR